MHRTFCACLLACLAIVVALWVSGCQREGTATQPQTGVSAEATALAASTSCLTCHDGIEEVHLRYPLGCAQCHGGDPNAFIKELAHVLPQQRLPDDATILPEDYSDDEYLRFKNPSDFRIVQATCGQSGQGLGTGCHSDFAPDLSKSMMATMAGDLTLTSYEGGLLDELDTPWGVFAKTSSVDPDADGAVGEIDEVSGLDTSYSMTSFERHYSDIQGKACANCHLWSTGDAIRGEAGKDGFYRSQGCAACHMEYLDSGLSESLDSTIDKTEPGHARIHRLDKNITTNQCAHCHTEGHRIGLAYQGMAELPPGTPTGENYEGLTPNPVYGEYRVLNTETAPADVHLAAGLHCIDCHVTAESHGDGNIYVRMGDAVEIGCRDCHGDHLEYGDMVTRKGTAYDNLRWDGDTMILTGKIDGVEHEVSQVKDLTDIQSPDFNFFAWRYMNSDHLKDEGGLECYTCHSGWHHHNYGTHVKRDLSATQLDPLTGEETDGAVDVNQKFMVNYRNFHMAYNAKGRIAPVSSVTQPILSVTGHSGEPLLEHELPLTASDLSGLSLKPVQSHTTVSSSRICQECHTNPSALGFGTDSFSLTRRYAFAIGSAETPDGNGGATGPIVDPDAVTSGTRGLLVIDRTNPSDPTLVGRLELMSPSGVLPITDPALGTTDIVYVTDAMDGLVVIDTSRASAPKISSTVKVGTPADMARTGQTLFIAAGLDGVHSYDISDPESPTFISTLETTDARGLFVHGKHLLIADGAAGLVVASIDVDGNAETRATLDLNGNSDDDNQANDVFAFAHYGDPPDAGLKPFRMIAYVADGEKGIRVVSLENLDDPRVIRTQNTENAQAVFAKSHWFAGDDDTASVEREFLFLADGEGGLRLLNILNPSFPQIFVTISNIGNVRDVVVANSLEEDGTRLYAYVALGSGGGAIYDYTNITSPVEASSLPLLTASAIDVERVQLDRYVDEEGNSIKDMSHDGARPFTREEIERILDADL